MAKKFTASSQQLEPDPKYNSKLISKFINCLMWDGKKSTAQQVFYDAMDIISNRVKDAEAFDVFEKAINNVKPMIEVRSKRIGGDKCQTPAVACLQVDISIGEGQKRQTYVRAAGF